MDLIKCDTCFHYFEVEDVQKVEQKMVCYGCTKACKNCNRSFDVHFDSEYCYWCLEGNLV